MSTSALTNPASSDPVPILLLKTRSQPHDVYEDRFTSAPPVSALTFRPAFIPVLEHTQNKDTLDELGSLLQRGALKDRYGGMVFTSQRAVEAWADVVARVEEARRDEGEGDGSFRESDLTAAHDSRTNTTFQTDIDSTTPFPLYVVGPATARALETLLTTLTDLPSPSKFLSLKPSIHGADTGSGALLAPFILEHYNTLQAHKTFTYHDAPRLPFIPLLGMGSENYSRRRLSASDPRLQKKPLLFLVGETRRDIIPKTLMDNELGKRRVEVEEVEVYRTEVRAAFREEFEEVVRKIGDQRAGQGQGYRPDSARVAAIVVFSPQGSGDMLKAVGYIDEQERVTEKARTRWADTDVHINTDTNTSTNTSPGSDVEVKTEGAVDAAAVSVSVSDKPAEVRYIIVTIGPTTRDHLRNAFGFEPDVCAKKPSPEGVRDGLEAFLKGKGLV